MSAKQRADLITKLYRYCKKEYPAIAPPSNRTVIEHMLYGCCLENSTVEAADEAFAKLQENYFDWNEVRVTTVTELAEIMKPLADPRKGASSIKKTLHGIFESYYQFDLEFLRKENLSKAVTTFEKFKGVSPFVVSYVAQHGLGGHSIPLDRSMMLLFYTLGIVTEDEATHGRVPGLERTIPKAKGIEFSSVVHQLAVAFYASPFSTKTRAELLKINKDAKELFPKRGAKAKSAAATTTESAAEVAEKAEPTKKKTASKKVTVVEKVTPAAKTKKVATKKVATKKATTKKATAKPATKKKASKASAKKKAPIRKKMPAKLSAKSSGHKSLVAKQLARKNPK
jgi:endonuclease III